MTIRAFIALTLPPLLQQTVIKQTARLRQNLSEELVRWIPAKNLHLTLKFLGEIPETHLGFIKQSLTEIANSSTAFDLQISGIGSFPNSKLPHVLWVGVHIQMPLRTLHQSIENVMGRLGYKKDEHLFSPHLTIGRVSPRVSQSDHLKIRQAIQVIQLGNIGTARVNSVHLFKSELNPAGSEYTNLFSANFKE